MIYGEKTCIYKVIAEKYECPHCGHEEYIESDDMSYGKADFGEVIECEVCAGEFLVMYTSWEEE